MNRAYLDSKYWEQKNDVDCHDDWSGTAVMANSISVIAAIIFVIVGGIFKNGYGDVPTWVTLVVVCSLLTIAGVSLYELRRLAPANKLRKTAALHLTQLYYWFNKKQDLLKLLEENAADPELVQEWIAEADSMFHKHEENLREVWATAMLRKNGLPQSAVVSASERFDQVQSEAAQRDFDARLAEAVTTKSVTVEMTV